MQRLIVVLIGVLQEIVGFANGVDNSVFVFRFYKRPPLKASFRPRFFREVDQQLVCRVN